MSLIWLRLDAALLLPEDAKRKIRRLLKELKKTSLSSEQQEELGESIGDVVEDAEQWSHILQVLLPEQYEDRRQTPQGTNASPGHYDKILMMRRRAKRGLSVFSKKDG